MWGGVAFERIVWFSHAVIAVKVLDDLNRYKNRFEVPHYYLRGFGLGFGLVPHGI